MKMKMTNYKIMVVGFILNSIIVGCSSNDDSGNSESELKRTIIKMDPSENSEIDWNNVKLIWEDEFLDPGISDKIWTYDTNDQNTPYTEGLQIYQTENAEVNGGTLKIYVKEEAGVYTSARLSSKYAFQYGRIEIAAKLPEEGIKGIWAKFALLGDNLDEIGWPQSGEIDIMDYFSNTPNKIFNYIHSSTNNSNNGTLISSNYPLETAEEEFHAYGILWTDEYIKFYIDNPDNITYSFFRPSTPTEENWPFDKPFFLLIRLVIGGQYGGEGVDASLFPGSMEIDYIRVYHPE